MIGGKLYDFDYSGVTKDRWGQTLNPFMKGLDALIAQNLLVEQQKQQQQEQKEEELTKNQNQYGLRPTTEEGLATIIASNPDLNQEDIEVITAMQGPQAGQGLADMSTPQRRQFSITPEMQQRAAAVDYLLGSQPGTALNQLMGQYKDLVASADEKAIGDFERERAYQDTRADKAKAEERAERAYQDAKAKEQREIEKQRMEYIDKRLEGLQGPAFRAATETAKANVANEARNLDPERFAGKSDEEILERLKLGVEPSKTSGLTFEQQIEKMREEYKLKEGLEKIKKEAKVAQTAAKDAGKMGDAEKELMKKEAANIGKEVDKLQEENRKIQDFQSVYDKNMERLNILEEASKNIDNLLNRAGAAIGPAGVGKAAVLFDDDIAAALEEIKSLATQVNTAMMSFIKEDGATGKMMDTEKEQLKLLGTISDLPSKIGWGTTEQTVKESLLSGIKRYRDKIQEYNAKIKSMNKNYNDNENRLNNMKSDFDTKYGLNKNKPVKSGTTKTAAGFKITIK